MEETTEISNHTYTYALHQLFRATQHCIKKCDSLNNNGELSSKQTSCLNVCAENSAISTLIHGQFIRKLAETKSL